MKGGCAHACTRAIFLKRTSPLHLYNHKFALERCDQGLLHFVMTMILCLFGPLSDFDPLANVSYKCYDKQIRPRKAIMWAMFHFGH